MFEFYLRLICAALFVYKMWLLYVGKVNKEEGAEKVVECYKRKFPSGDFDDFEEPLKKKLRVENTILFRVNVFFDPEFDEEDEIEDNFSDDFVFEDLNPGAIEFINRDPRLNRSIDDFLREHADRFVMSPNDLPMDVVSVSSDSIVSVSSDSIMSISSDSIVSVSSESIMSVSSESIVSVSSDGDVRDGRIPGEIRGK